MRRFTKMMSVAFTLLAFCFLFGNVVTVNAAEKTPGKVYVEPVKTVKGKWVDTKKMRVVTDGTKTFDVEYAAGDSIKNLKVNKKGLTAAVTYTYSDSQEWEEAMGYSRITLYGTKPGTYTVSFTVVDINGKSRGKKKMTVQVVNSDSVTKKVTFGSQTVISDTVTYKNGTKKEVYKSNTKVKGSSGKLKVTPDSQYKITGLIVCYVDKNGKEVYKKVGNGANITLSKTYGYVSTSTGASNRSDKKLTYVWISYKDTFTGDTCKCSITKARGVKEVKRVCKNKLTGRTTVSYDAYANFGLWQY